MLRNVKSSVFVVFKDLTVGEAECRNVSFILDFLLKMNSTPW